VQVNWTGFTCPSGTGSVSAYKVTLTNGTFSADGSTTRSFSPTERPADVVVDDKAGQSLFATYTVTCTGNDTSRESDPSGQAQATITAPAAP
jgi:serine/threonine-protein kinase